MPVFIEVSGLSRLVLVKKVEQRFGLSGYGRLLKLLELVGDSLTSFDDPSVSLAWADVLEGLQAGEVSAWEFLTYCEEARALRVTRDDGRLQVTLCGELFALMASAPVSTAVQPGLVLFQTDEQWADWFAADLNCPPHLAGDVHTRQFYRHWCATNVTVAEVEAAVELAIRAKKAPLPSVLHEFLRTVRNTKIELARR